MKRIATIFLGSLLIFTAAQAQRGGRGAGSGIGAGGGLGLGGGGGIGLGGGPVLGTGMGAGTSTGMSTGARSGVEAGAGAASQTSVSATNSRTGTGISARGSAASDIELHPQLSSRASTLLPEGTTVTEASTGFRNTGEFLSAAHVSHNLGIPFDQLKAKMTAGESLGSAIHDLDANANAKAEVKKAKRQSHDDLHAKAAAKVNAEAAKQ